MATSTIKSNRVKAVNVTGTITRTNGAGKNITAPTESGYKFVAWVNAVTTGWVGVVNIEQATSVKTNLWVANVGTLNGQQGGFAVTALYQAD